MHFSKAGATVLAACITGVLAATPASAQHELLRRQLSGARLARVTQSGQTRLIPSPYLTQDTVVRSRTDSGIAVPLGDVERLERQVSGAGKGALLGAGLGVAAGLALGAALASDDWLSSDGGADVAVGGLLFGLIGSGAGALVGSTTTRWQTVYRVPRVRPMAAVRDARWRIGLQVRR